MKEWEADLDFFRWDLNVPIIFEEQEVDFPVKAFSFTGDGGIRERILVLCGSAAVKMTYKIYGN